jgi:hypothetical protein
MDLYSEVHPFKQMQNSKGTAIIHPNKYDLPKAQHSYTKHP